MYFDIYFYCFNFSNVIYFHLHMFLIHYIHKQSSGYSQSASLLAHNRITAPQFIRRSLHSSWYKQVPTHCLLLFVIEAGDLLDSVKYLSLTVNCNSYWFHLRVKLFRNILTPWRKMSNMYSPAAPSPYFKNPLKFVQEASYNS